MTSGKLLILFIFCLNSICLSAQKIESTVSGSIIDANSKAAIEFASVDLLKSSDSSLVKGTATDNKGKFNFSSVPYGAYLLRYSFIGYERSFVQVTVDKAKVNLGLLSIRVEAQQLANVTVTSTKTLLNTSIDRKSYDVTKDIMAQSGTASDILKNIPSVEVDMEGNVALRGAGNVIILVNGRPSPLFGKLNQAEVLQQFPANSIERIEVITNPTARFKPDGTSGIINIILKKNVKGGWNGSITGNVGVHDRYNASTTLNYNPGKLNIFGNFGIRKDYRYRTNEVRREYLDTTTKDTRGYYIEDGHSLARPLSYLATLGFTYNPNKNNSLGLSGNYSSRDQIRKDKNTKIFTDENLEYLSYLDRLRYDPEYEKEKDATVFFEHKFPGDDHTLRMEFNVATSKELEDNHYENRYYYPDSFSTFDNTRIFQGNNQQLITIDYSNNLSETSKLELGYAGSFNQQDFNFYGEYYDFSLGEFVEDKVKTNQFLYDQTVHGIYGTYEKKYKRFGYTFGLRLEDCFIKGNQVTKDTIINNDYFKLYPTLHLAYALSDTSQLQLNYSRRVHRPEGDDINPFPEYQDPYNIRAGNPNLLPEIIHSVEFGYKWQSKNLSLVPSLYYRYKENGFTQVTVPLNDSVFLTTQQNLSSDQSMGLEIIMSAKAGNYLTANLSTNLFYNQIAATNLGYVGNKDIVAFSSNFNSTITFSKNTMAQVSAIFYSSRLTPQGKKYPAFVMNAGIRQDFFKKKMSFILTASDILRTLYQKTELNTLYTKQQSIGRRDGQIVYIGLSYRFGKSIKKSEEKLQFDNQSQ